MLLFCQPITAKTFLNLSRVWTLFAFGFVKMAWPSIQQNQSPFRLAHQKGSNLFPIWNPVTSLVQASNSLIKLRSWGPRWTPISPWNPTPIIIIITISRFIKPTEGCRCFIQLLLLFYYFICSHKTTTKCLWRARRYTPETKGGQPPPPQTQPPWS